MQSQTHTSIEFSGILRIFTLTVGLIASGIILISFVIAIPSRFDQLRTTVSLSDAVLIPGLTPEMEAGPLSRLIPDEAQALYELGLSLNFYAGYILFFDVALVILGTVLANLIVWRLSHNWLAMWFAYSVILLGPSVSFVVVAKIYDQPHFSIIPVVFGMTGMLSHVFLLFLSPDGHFFPAWSRYLTTGFAGMILGTIIYSLSVLPDALLMLLSLLITFPFWIGILLIGIIAQISRYRRISNLVQRQQTKWIAGGLAMALIGILLNIIFLNASYAASSNQRIILNLLRAPAVNFFLMLFVLCLAFSIFRYRLWDIDLIIRRTLSYSVLTAVLALLYFGGIVLLQGIFGRLVGNFDTPLITVFSTLAIAGLFNPLRVMVQDFIDRYFFRSKYDAEKELSGFAAVARDEVDIVRLSASLLSVVERTIRPEHTSLWLKRTTRRD